MVKKIVIEFEPTTARVLEEMRATMEANTSAPEPSADDDPEAELRDINALVELSRAYAAGDEVAARAAKDRLSPRMCWEIENGWAPVGSGTKKPDSD